MKSTFLVASLLASLALASPIEERKVVVETLVVKETVTVTGTPPAPTGQPQAQAQVLQAPPAADFAPANFAPKQQSAPKQESAPEAPEQESSQGSGSSGGSVSISGNFKDQMLGVYNAARRANKLKTLEWDDNLAQKATQASAGLCNKGDKAAHDLQGGSWAQNTILRGNAQSAAETTFKSMYLDELEDWLRGDRSDNVGHLRNMLLTGAQRLGCNEYSPCGKMLCNVDPGYGNPSVDPEYTPELHF